MYKLRSAAGDFIKKVLLGYLVFHRTGKIGFDYSVSMTFDKESHLTWTPKHKIGEEIVDYFSHDKWEDYDKAMEDIHYSIALFEAIGVFVIEKKS